MHRVLPSLIELRTVREIVSRYTEVSGDAAKLYLDSLTSLCILEDLRLELRDVPGDHLNRDTFRSVISIAAAVAEERPRRMAA